MEKRCHILLPVSLFFAAIVGAEEKPKFTGQWKQAAYRDRIFIMEIEHQDPNLKVVTNAKWDAGRLPGSLTEKRTYTTDGAEQSGNSSQGREHWTIVNWQGSALVFLTVVRENCHLTVTRETWTLSDVGRSLTKTRRIIDPTGLAVQKLVFEKQ